MDCASRTHRPPKTPPWRLDDLPLSSSLAWERIGRDNVPRLPRVLGTIERSEAEETNEAHCTRVHSISASMFSAILSPLTIMLNTSHRPYVSLVYTAQVGAVPRLFFRHSRSY